MAKKKTYVSFLKSVLFKIKHIKLKPMSESSEPNSKPSAIKRRKDPLTEDISEVSCTIGHWAGYYNVKCIVWISHSKKK